GYDGYGTFHLRNPAELKRFFKVASRQSNGWIGEPRVQFRRELAVTLVRGRDGKVIDFPFVESKQIDSRCTWVKGPIHHRSAGRLLARLKNFLKTIRYVGAISFELFDTSEGLLINEIAPRVHNSAHYSLDAMSLDQFSAHLLALAGEALES